MINFVMLDAAQPDIARLIAAMAQARDAVGRRSWSHPQHASSEDWWADVFADPRARRREPRATDLPLRRAFYTLADEPSAIILVACTKCDWKAAYRRDELIERYGRDHNMPGLLKDLAAPDCPKTEAQWDRCGAHYADPIDGGKR